MLLYVCACCWHGPQHFDRVRPLGTDLCGAGSCERGYPVSQLFVSMPAMQVDRVWDRKGLLYNPYMANMPTRRQYYLMQRLLRTDVVSLLEDCNGQWAGTRCMGDRACGDESAVPHKGPLAGPLKMFIARKPHPTGIKLYCPADATWGYVVNMYLYTGAWGTLRRYSTAAGNFDAKNIMKLWPSLLHEGTVLCADSFWGPTDWQRNWPQARGHSS